MDEFQRTSLAEFSRLYLLSRQPDRDKLNVQLGSNAPLWSLGLEWCFYFLFPVIFVTCKVADRFSYHVVAVSVAAVILFVLVGDLAGYWMIWCSGALARRWLGQRGTSNREA